MTARVGRAIGLGLLTAGVGAGWLLRDLLGFEAGPEGVRELVARAGLWGPVALVLVVAFRHLLLVPSQVVLVAAGFCFGTVGIFYGALGLVLSAALYFGFTRWLGREAVLARASPRVRAVLDVLGERPGGFLVGAATAYPLGLLPAYWTAAGLTGMPWPTFGVAVALGGLVRAGSYVLLGNAILEADAGQLAAAAAALLLLLALPLSHPRVRAWLRRIRAAEPAPRPRPGAG